MTEFRLERNDNGTYESDLFDVTLVTNANPFGDHGTAFILDRDGQKFDNYPRGTRVDFEARAWDSGNSWSDKLNGYVVERREAERNGVDILEVEAYALDTLLRRNTVGADLSGQSMQDALKEIIQDWTPVTWNASNVDIVDNQTIQRGFENERVDNILQIFSRKSGSETFGVNSSTEFYFRPPETSKVARGIDKTNVLGYDLPERGEEALNEARVYWDEGDRVVTVDESKDKLELKNSLGTTDPVTQAEPFMRESITNRQDARAVGNEILQDRSDLLTGTVTTYGLLGAEPGDAIDISIPTRGVRDEFRIAQLEYRDGEDETILTVAESAEDQQKSDNIQNDMLVRMSDTLKRVEMRPAAPAGDLKEDTRVLETKVGGNVEADGTLDGTPLAVATLTNGGFNALRDAWRNGNTISVANVVVGTDGSSPSRSDTSLGSQSESVTVSPSTLDPNVVVFDVDLTTADDIVEWGIEDGSGNLLARATFKQAVSDPNGVRVTLTFEDNPNITDAVWTETGQQTARDILADNSPTHSKKYAVGSGTADVATGDTSLTTQENAETLGNEIVADADSSETWTDLVEVTPQDPYYIDEDNNKLVHAQTAWTEDAQDVLLDNSSTRSDSSYTGGTAAKLDGDDGARCRFTFEVDHKIEPSNISVALRHKDVTPDSQLQILLDDEAKTVSVDDSLGWQEYTGWSTTLEPGRHSIEVNSDLTFLSADADLDVISVLDNRHYTVSGFDNDNGDNSSYLSDPANYPSQTDVGLGGFDQDIGLSREITNADVGSSWNDTSNSQAIIIEGNTTNNSTSASASGFTATDALTVKLRLSRFGTQTGTTPTSGTSGQTVSSVDVTAGTDGINNNGPASLEFRSNIPPNTINGTTITESGILDGNGDTQTRVRFADILVEDDQLVATYEILQWQMGPGSRPVNQSEFAPTVVSSSTIASGDLTNTANYQMRITGFRSE